MQYNEQTIQQRRTAVNSFVLNLDRYIGKCETCRAPARLVTGSNEINGVETWQVCINPFCWQFDSDLVFFRRKLEDKAKESKSFRRHRDRLWKAARAQIPRMRRLVWN